jgi:ArsR family transcriptional regulator
MNDDDLAVLERLFQALADRTRLRLLNLMAEGELCVCYFVEILGEPQPKISRHLAYLRDAGIVDGRRDGKWIHYAIVRPQHPGMAAILDTVLETLAEDRDLRKDREALRRACCAVRLPPSLRNAPRPAIHPAALPRIP